MKKVIRLTEDDLTRIVRRVIKEEVESGEDGYHAIYKQFESQTIGKGHPVYYSGSKYPRWVMTWNFVDEHSMWPKDNQKWAAELEPVFDKEPKQIKRVGPKIASQARLVIYLPEKQDNSKKWDKITRMVKPYTGFVDVGAKGYEHKVFYLDKSTAGNGIEVILKLKKGLI